MSTLADLRQAPVLDQHYSSSDDLRKNEFVQAKQEIVPEFNSCMAVCTSFLTVPLITGLPLVRRAIMPGLLKSLTIDPILLI